MGMMRVLSRLGDERFVWDDHPAADGDHEASAAIREAERIFAAQRAKGSMAFKIEKGHVPTRLDQFDPLAEQIVIVPRVVGG